MKIIDIFKGVDTVSVDEAKKMIAAKSQDEIAVLDVRQPEEYEQGHLPGAHLIPLPELLRNLEKLDSSKTILTYCKRGPRSSTAARLLKDHGFNSIYSLEGGIDAWNGLVASGQYETGMFLLEGRETTEELLSLAWSLEEGSLLFYSQVKDSVSDDESRSIFESLVRAEEKHKASIFETYKRVAKGHIKDGESIVGFMESGIPIDKAFSWVKDQDRSLYDILEFSMLIETNALDLYMKMLGEIKDEIARTTFQTLIEEEKIHLSRLGKLLGSKINNDS